MTQAITAEPRVTRQADGMDVDPAPLAPGF